MQLSDKQIEQIASQIAEELRKQPDIRDIVIGEAMGEGAIPLYGRENRKEPCSCCLINPKGKNKPENRICTTKGGIGVLSNQEERSWCSEINLVSDGRCKRAWEIHQAAEKCKQEHPEDTKAFFECYAPRFSEATK